MRLKHNKASFYILYLIFLFYGVQFVKIARFFCHVTCRTWFVKIAFFLTKKTTYRMKTETNNIHHACKCTGQNFTFEEWGKYLKENHDDIVHRYKNFHFNICDVCLTPNVKIEWANKFCNFKIETAQSDNERWSFGYSYNFYNSGGR